MTWMHPYLDHDTEAYVKQLVAVTGHLAMPFGKPQPLPVDLVSGLEGISNEEKEPLSPKLVAELDKLSLAEPAMQAAIQSYQHFMVLNLEPLVAKHYPERRSAAPKIDGKIGSAMLELLEQPRCRVPDYSPAMTGEAVGSGQWRSCHNIGKFHGAIVKVANDPPNHLKRPHNGNTVWDAVKRRCQECYAEVGLRFWFSDDVVLPETEGHHQTELSFVGRSAGWIGLALIGQGEQCSSNPIWLRLLSTYLQSSAITDKYLTLWANLLIHELGHNCGSGHTSGGIMNPSILSVPNTWIDDPAEPRMKGWFGGQPVSLDDDEPPPDSPPPPFPGAWIGELVNITSNQKVKLLGLPS